MTDLPEMSLLEKLYSETAQISWLELQRFFAQGLVMNVDPSLDLPEVALMFAEDKSKELALLVESSQVSAPSNDQARVWYAQEAELWSVVVAPFVLVQDRGDSLTNKESAVKKET